MKKLCFLHSMRGCKNVVVSSVMEGFVRCEEYTEAYIKFIYAFLYSSERTSLP